METERKVTLKVIGEPEFTLRRDKLSLIFWWETETEAKNIIWIRAYIIGIHWPPLLRLNFFHDVSARNS